MFVIVNRMLDAYYNGFSGLRYYNSGRFCKPSELWTTKFVEACGLNPTFIHPINITSVFGSARLLNADRRGVNIFYTGENIHADMYHRYKSALSTLNFDISLGFDYSDADNYLRFPYWLLAHFSPASTYEDVKLRVQQLRSPLLEGHDRFCCLISRHDRGGIRTKMADALSMYGKIDYAGSFKNNTDEMLTCFADNKVEFMKQYMFNICPENTNTTGYVTEKVFDAFEAGCIPVYWGSDNNPEPDLINKNAVLFYDDKDDCNALADAVADMMTNKSSYQDFIHIPRLLPYAEEIVWRYFERLRKKLITIYRNKK